MSSHAEPRASDPVTRYPRPPFPDQQQDHPGSTAEMDPRPDHGEDSYQGHDVLLDRVAVVTGGDSGIGRAVCLAFAREGADVVFTHLPEEADEAAETARLVGEAGRKAIPVLCDIRDEAECTALIDQTVSELGRVDILVNNAAYQMSQPNGIEAITTVQFDRVMKTNLYGMFWLSRAALAHMPRGGSVINTASVQGYQPTDTPTACLSDEPGLEESVEAGGVGEGELGQVDHDLVRTVRPSDHHTQGISQQRPTLEVHLTADAHDDTALSALHLHAWAGDSGSPCLSA